MQIAGSTQDHAPLKEAHDASEVRQRRSLECCSWQASIAACFVVCRSCWGIPCQPRIHCPRIGHLKSSLEVLASALGAGTARSLGSCEVQADGEADLVSAVRSAFPPSRDDDHHPIC